MGDVLRNASMTRPCAAADWSKSDWLIARVGYAPLNWFVLAWLLVLSALRHYDADSIQPQLALAPQTAG